MITVHDIQAPDPADSSPLHDDAHRTWSAVAVKGAPDVVLRLCTRIQTMDDQVRLLDESMRQRSPGGQRQHDQGRLARVGVGLPADRRRTRGRPTAEHGAGPDLCGPGRHDRPGPRRSQAGAGDGPRCRHSHDHDHRRLSQHGARHRRGHRPAAPGPRRDDRGRTQRPGRRRPGRPASKRPTCLPAFRPSTRCASWMPCAPTTKWWP